MARKYPTLEFWGRCVRAAACGSSQFANDWQWLTGVPLLSLGVYYIYPERNAVTIFPNHPVLDLVVVAGVAFVITWLMAFVGRLFEAPVAVYEEQRQRADGLQRTVDAAHIERERIAAITAQTDEMRLAREQQKHATHPAVRAFNDIRYEDVRSGIPIEEAQLGIVVWWVANNSAWGRWYAAQIHQPVGHDMVLRVAESYFLTLLERGTLATRGYRDDARDSNEVISPDWWALNYFQIKHDKVQSDRAIVHPRNGVKSESLNSYTGICCEWPKVKAIFSEKDDKIDALTAALTSGA